MPRPKVINRRRVLRACTTCKRRKERCDGAQPCGRCRHRARESECTFLDVTSCASALDALTIPNGSREASSERAGSRSFRESHQDTSGYNHYHGDSTAPASASAASAPVQQLSRFLQDPKGKFIYIGDSASLSFLQTVRRIVETSIGDCQFTTDKWRHQLIETSSTIYDLEAAFGQALPDLNEALNLSREFAVAVSGALDLFDKTYISRIVHVLFENPTKPEWPERCIIHLVLAIGAQARARDHLDECFAEQHFIQGRNYAMRHLVDDPSIFTVQAFSLITWYMVTASRRNGATMNLGFAVQAAYALGIHRHQANSSFGPEIAKSRERAWKTLRVCDLFLSASMGRPSITSRIDANVPSESLSMDANERLSSAMTRICLIFERILSEVYSRRAVSLELATSISEQHRIWTGALPEMLEADGISPEGLPGPPDLTKTLGSAIVVMAYHYSIILLTRPFLTFRINAYVKGKQSWQSKSIVRPDITTYSDACVHSAVSGIELACNILSYDKMPKRLPLVVNSVFISALVIGLAYWGDYHCRAWALDQSLDSAIRILQHFGLKSPQPARYQQIIEYLREAIIQYKEQRQEMIMKSHNRQVSNIFGNVSAHLDRGRISTVRTNTDRSPEINSGGQVLSISDGELYPEDSASSTFGNPDNILRDSLITTSGNFVLPQPGQEGVQFAHTFLGEYDFSPFIDDMSANTTGDIFSLDGGPLFALTQQYYPI